MRKLIGIFAIALVGMIVGGAVVAGLGVGREDNGSTTATDDGGTAVPTGIDGGARVVDFSALYEEVRPSIVRITTGEEPDDAFFRRRDGLGSGVIIDRDGHVLTNNHVVRGFDAATVTFADGTVATGRVVGRDPGNDIAMLKVVVNSSVLQPAQLGDSSAIRVGQVVAAIGSPFGLDGTLTTGIISGIDRTLPSGADGRPLRGLLQTDAAVNPGNSGGALLNEFGEVIGINTAIESPTGGAFSGIAYAVPINTPKRFMTRLISGETIDHPRLGISGRTLSTADARQLGVPHGVAVIAVDPGSAADGAGLRSSINGQGDVIVAIDGEPMTTFEALADYIDTKNVGDEVTLTIVRDGEELELTARLQAWNSSA
jgi:S1-C subfamily serine protease